MTPLSNIVLVVLGATASGKTALGVRLAHALGGEIISADSRQVYHGLDIGSGKDLEEYRINGVDIAYHLIDVVDLAHEFSVFEYQRRFYDTLTDLRARQVLPVVVGGTGLYLAAVLSSYRLLETPPNPALRAELSALSQDELVQRLLSVKGKIHNKTDIEDADRIVRAIEIAEFARTRSAEAALKMEPLILGTRWPRPDLHRRIEARLRARMEQGLIEEVEGLLAQGVRAKRLRLLGLEYRYVSEYLTGTIRNRNDLVQKLSSAIKNFAKRQETWFRRMERGGDVIHWLEGADFDTAVDLVKREWHLDD